MKFKDGMIRCLTMCCLFTFVCVVLSYSAMILDFMLIGACHVEWLLATNSFQPKPFSHLEIAIRVLGSLLVLLSTMHSHHLMTTTFVIHVILIFTYSLYSTEKRGKTLTQIDLLILCSHITGAWMMYMFSHTMLLVYFFQDGVWAVVYGMVHIYILQSLN